ncbi:hypothetical protein OKW24_001149 [Peribacillus simplex]|nr:hypothetical protein [Peribacillus simplex]MDF9759376.1 hypothetical protein [Peribacillus simplex]
MLFSFSKISASAILIGELKEHDTSETSHSFDIIFKWSLSFASITTDETLTIFEIGRSLSMKGCPYDNAVAEATFKIIKRVMERWWRVSFNLVIFTKFRVFLFLSSEKLLFLSVTLPFNFFIRKEFL